MEKIYKPRTFENLIEQVRRGGNPSINEVLACLRAWGVPVAGNGRIYWPRDSLYVAHGVSEVAGAILARLFSDPRIEVAPVVVGGVLEYDSPRREFASNRTDRGFASSKQIAGESVFSKDYQATGFYFRSTEELTHDDIEVDQTEPGVVYHYVG